MVEWIAKYYQVISVLFGLLAAIGVISAIAYRVTVLYTASASKKAKDKRELMSQINEIKKELHHLNNPDDGRVNRLSEMVKDQVTECRKATNIAAYVKGRFDQMDNQ